MRARRRERVLQSRASQTRTSRRAVANRRREARGDAPWPEPARARRAFSRHRTSPLVRAGAPALSNEATARIPSSCGPRRRARAAFGAVCEPRHRLVNGSSRSRTPASRSEVRSVCSSALGMIPMRMSLANPGWPITDAQKFCGTSWRRSYRALTLVRRSRRTCFRSRMGIPSPLPMCSARGAAFSRRWTRRRSLR